MGRQIEDDADVANTRREWAEAARVQVEGATKIASREALLQLGHRRVKALDMAHSQLQATRRGTLDQPLRLLECAGDRLLHQHARALLQGERGDLIMQV